MKRQLMTAMALVAWTAAAFAADGNVMDYEQGKVYGPIEILGEEAVTVDGHGAIIDGEGKARCATLGPKVTLVNFTLRNGKAAIGGGVVGGRVENCTIRDCTATEYGAAVANCEVSQTAIIGCQRPLDGEVKAAMHGGIAADSVLDDVTVSGCYVEMGTEVPCFGGIAANSDLDGCTVTDNEIVIDGDHYGHLFYGGTLNDSAVIGNSVDSSLANIDAYMKVTPNGCTLDGDIPQPEAGAFAILFKVPQGMSEPAAMNCVRGKVYRLPDLPSGYKWRRLDAEGRLYDGGLLVFNLAEQVLLVFEAVRVP